MNKIRTIEISFDAEVNLPDGFHRALDGLVGMVCAQYQKENPSRVMWPAGGGCKPLSGFFGGDGPMFDETVYIVECAEREDLYGENEHNPQREELREKLRAARAARKKGGT